LGTYYYFVEDDYPNAFKYLKEALEISQKTGDFLNLVLASYWLSMALCLNCEFEKAEHHAKIAIEINQAAKNDWGVALIKGNLSHFCYAYQGKVNLGLQTAREALQLAEACGDIWSIGVAHAGYGSILYAKGQLEEAEKIGLKSIEFFEKINQAAWNGGMHFVLGDFCYEMGDLQKSKDHFKKGCSIYEGFRLFPSMIRYGEIGLLRAKVRNREKEVDLNAIYVHWKNNRIKILEGFIQRYIGEILLNVDNQHLSEAEHWIQKAIEADQRNRMMINLGIDYALYAELFKRKGDRLKAQENLGKAIEILRECGADGWVEKYEKELAAISSLPRT